MFFCWFESGFFNKVLFFFLGDMPFDSVKFWNLKCVIPVTNSLMSGSGLWILVTFQDWVFGWRSCWMLLFLTSQLDTLTLLRRSPPGAPLGFFLILPPKWWRLQARKVGLAVSAEVSGTSGSARTGFLGAFPPEKRRSSLFGFQEEAIKFLGKGVSAATSASRGSSRPALLVPQKQRILTQHSALSTMAVAICQVYSEPLGVSVGCH